MKKSKQETTLEAFVKGAEIINFSAKELLTMGAGNETGKTRGLNHLPPMDKIHNIYETAILAQKIRTLFGSPILILSAYRSGPYNYAIGGARTSQHLEFRALDLCSIDGRQSRLQSIALEIIGNKGGVGTYSWGCHIDTRGYRARW